MTACTEKHHGNSSTWPGADSGNLAADCALTFEMRVDRLRQHQMRVRYADKPLIRRSTRSGRSYGNFARGAVKTVNAESSSFCPKAAAGVNFNNYLKN